MGDGGVSLRVWMRVVTSPPFFLCIQSAGLDSCGSLLGIIVFVVVVVVIIIIVVIVIVVVHDRQARELVLGREIKWWWLGRKPGPVLPATRRQYLPTYTL